MYDDLKTFDVTAQDEISQGWGKHRVALAEWAMNFMVNRTDACGAHTALDVRGTMGNNEKPIGKNYTCKRELTPERLQWHFSEQAKPQHVLGVHTIAIDNTCKAVSVDIDAHSSENDAAVAARNREFALAVFGHLDQLGLRPMLWDSNGKGGYHIDVIFSKPIPAADAYRFAKWTVRNWKEFGFSKAPESFPKQDEVTEYGNWLRLIGRHHTRDIWATVYDPESGEWLSGEAAALAVLAHRPVTPAAIPPEAIAEPSEERARENRTTPVYRNTADDDIKTACAALSVIPATEDYDHWLKVGMACHGVSESLLPEWEAWSSGSSSYANGRYTCEEKWQTFGRKSGKAVGIGTLCLLATQATGGNSWRPERPIDPNVNIDGILNGFRSTPQEQPAPPEQSAEEFEVDIDDDIEQADDFDRSFPEECLRPQGLLSEVVDYNLRTALYPQPEHALAGALALMSVLTGRRVRDESGTRTNIMIVGLGPTRSGKEHSRQINKKLMEMCRIERLYEEKCASHAALHGFLKDDGVGLLMNDEFGDFLALARSTKGMNTQPAQIISAMLKLYSSASGKYKADRYADNTKQVEINQPHLVLYGSSTAEVFWKHCTPEYLSGGLFGRVMIFENRGYVNPNLDAKSLESNPPQPGVYDEMMGWLNWGAGDFDFIQNPIPFVFQHTPEAKQRFQRHWLAISEKRQTENELRAALWSGTAEITAKLALLFACSRSRKDQTVELQDVNLAIRLSNWLTRRKIELSRDNVAENAVESSSKRVYRMIKEAERRVPLTRSALTRKTQWLKASERNELIASLEAGKQIVCVPMKTKTKTKEVFRTFESFKKQA